MARPGRHLPMLNVLPETSPQPAEPSEQVFPMGKLCEDFGMTPRALRFYESRGFITPRRQGSARLYGQTDYDRLALILKAKRLGFTLREIGDLLAERAAAGGPQVLQLSRRQCTEQINLLERQKRAIEFALTELRRTYSDHYLASLSRGEAKGDQGESNRP